MKKKVILLASVALLAGSGVLYAFNNGGNKTAGCEGACCKQKSCCSTAQTCETPCSCDGECSGEGCECGCECCK
jgi:hypothetical protein